MSQTEFYDKGLHNVHIKFFANGNIYTGVIYDDVFHVEGKTKRSDYTYIPTKNLREHQAYQRQGDRFGMASLSGVVDVESIVWAERIKAH